MELSRVLCEPLTPTRHVYFPITGFISLIAPSSNEPSVEVGMVGREGMLGVQLALGVPTVPMRGLVQGAGTAWRCDTASFRAFLAENKALQRTLNRYIYILMSQFITSATCLRFHSIRPRLARWLLMTQDRANSSRFPVTQEFLAMMLGVRRVGITDAAKALQKAGLIEYHRGDLRVLNRSGLQSAACSCYATDLATYSRVLQ